MEAERRAQAWRYQPQFRRPHHFHIEPELNVFTRGHASLQVGSETFEVRAGDILWLPAGVEHSLRWGSPELEFSVVGFHPALLDAAESVHQRTPLFPQGVRITNAPAAEFGDVCLAMSNGLSPQDGDHALLDALSRVAPASGSGWLHLGEKGAQLIAQQPSLSRTELAKRLRSNNGDVSRSFRQALATSFREHRTHMRLMAFVREVDAGTNMTKAALSSGFGSYSQFHRAFRDVLHCSPSEFFRPEFRAEQANLYEPLQAVDNHVDSA